MKEGSYLCSRFHSGYSVEGYVYERDIWLKKGLVLTDDNRALVRNPPRPGLLLFHPAPVTSPDYRRPP